MAHRIRSAWKLRLLAIGAAATLAACAHEPPAPSARQWLAAAPESERIVGSAEKRCRKRTEVGTRIPVTRCLTVEEEMLERQRATTLLGLVGGGSFRNGG